MGDVINIRIRQQNDLETEVFEAFKKREADFFASLPDSLLGIEPSTDIKRLKGIRFDGSQTSIGTALQRGLGLIARDLKPRKRHLRVVK